MLVHMQSGACVVDAVLQTDQLVAANGPDSTRFSRHNFTQTLENLSKCSYQKTDQYTERVTHSPDPRLKRNINKKLLKWYVFWSDDYEHENPECYVSHTNVPRTQ